MSLAVDTMHGLSPSSKMPTQLQPKKTKAVLVIDMASKVIICLVITNKMEHSSFKSGLVVQVAKRSKEDWLLVLQFSFGLK